ncbi:MAG: hypothetical protein K9L26_02690 [Candidatus Izimaplasma sp.]|nr:hypothetical protein [Candidatus Izimaplasma bacterium]
MSKEEFNKLKRNVQYSEASIAKLNGQLVRTSDKIKQLSNANFEKIGKLGSTLTKSVTVPILCVYNRYMTFHPNSCKRTNLKTRLPNKLF